MKAQRGGFVVGLVVGLLIGLALALGVALYVTKVPVPFINKVPQRTADQDAAEAERNKNWDPNARAGRPGPRPRAGRAAPAAAPAAPPRRRAAAARRRRRRRRDRAPAPRAGAAAASAAAPRPSRRGRPVHLLRPGRRLHAAPKTPSSSAPSWRCWAWTPRSPNASRPGAPSTACASARSKPAPRPMPRIEKLQAGRRRIQRWCASSGNELCSGAPTQVMPLEAAKEAHETP